MSTPIIIRGTTPTLTLSGLDQDLTTWTVYVTFEWDVFIDHERITGQFTKSGNDLTVTSDSVAVALSQEDTLSFPEKDNRAGELPRVNVQIRAYKSGSVVATSVNDDNAWFYVGTALLESEIPLEA